MNNQMLTECPMCYDLYDEEFRIPRNLVCGHTYCEYCLNFVYNQKLRIECPTCRCKHEPNLKPNQLSKNYIASDLAIKEKQSKSKYEFCDKHQEPLQFYCQDDDQNICSDCIVEHSGHKFQKITISLKIISQRVQDLGDQMQKKLDLIEKSKEDLSNLQNCFSNKKSQDKKYVDEQFEKILKSLLERKQKVYNEINQFYDTQQSEIDLQIALQNSNQDIYKEQLEKLEKIDKQIQKEKFITDDKINNELKDCQEQIDKENKQQQKLIEQNDNNNNILDEDSIPNININLDPLINSISTLGKFQKIHEPKICFLGNKNQILQFDIQKNEWCLNVLNNKYFELNFYASAVTLPNGDIFIMGGGVSNKAYQVSVKRNFMVIQKSSMKQSRKEHASLIIDKKIYVLGGFDSVNKKMLGTCEVYDYELDIWKQIAPMSKPKCALAVTSVNKKHIYVVGGFDGEQRLNTIERYDIEKNTWNVLDIKLQNSLSNSACIQVDKENIIILGGGNDEGFSDQSILFNTVTNQLEQVPSMKEGRDLRNKLVKYRGKLYAIGGHNYLGSSYDLKSQQWRNISSYGELIQDHLDSWSCAMSYSYEDDEDMAQYEIDKNHHIYHSQPYKNNQQNQNLEQDQQQRQQYHPQQQQQYQNMQQNQQPYYDYQPQQQQQNGYQGNQNMNVRNTNPIRPYNPNIHQFIYDNLPHHNIQGNNSLYEQQYQEDNEDELPDIQDPQQQYY